MSIHHLIRKNFTVLRFREGDLRGLCLEPFADLKIAELPWDTLREHPDPKYRLEKTSHTRRVISFLWEGPPLDSSEPIRLYAKRAKVRGNRKTLMSFLRPSKSRKEFLLGLRMFDLQIPTPLPVFYAERRVAGFLRENYLVTIELKGARSFASIFPALATQEQKVAAMREAALFILENLKKGFQHVDCEAAHIFVEGDATNALDHRQMYYIDVDGGKLNVAASDRVRRKMTFQFFRSFRPGILDREAKRSFVQALYEREFSDAELDDFLARLEKMEAFVVRRKRILKALYLKRKGKHDVNPQSAH